MITLKGHTVTLRALEPEDLEFLYAMENDEDVWKVSHTITPFSKYILTQYLEQSHRDIYDVKQLRLIIETTENAHTVGCVDLFDFDPQHHRAGIGIIIFNTTNRGKGFATETLQLVKKYAQNKLQMHQLFANIITDNVPSITLFENAGFEKIGTKREWIFENGKYKDEAMYQCILT